MPQQRTGRRPGAAGQRRVDLPARDAARRGVHLQARAGAGCGLQHPAAQPAPARFTPVLRRHWRASSRRSWPPSRSSWRRHCAEAGLTEKAVATGSKRAGRRRALGHDGSGGAVAERIGVAGQAAGRCLRREQELDLQIERARALIPTKGYASPEVGETILRARVLADQLDRPEYRVPLLIPMDFSFRSSRAQGGAVACRATARQRKMKPRGVRSQPGRETAVLYLGQFVAARALLEDCAGPERPGASRGPATTSGH